MKANFDCKHPDNKKVSCLQEGTVDNVHTSGATLAFIWSRAFRHQTTITYFSSPQQIPLQV